MKPGYASAAGLTPIDPRRLTLDSQRRTRCPTTTIDTNVCRDEDPRACGDAPFAAEEQTNMIAAPRIAALKAHYHPVSPGLAPRGPAYDQVIDVSLQNQELFKNVWP
jgi:hypothetical protein